MILICFSQNHSGKFNMISSHTEVRFKIMGSVFKGCNVATKNITAYPSSNTDYSYKVP